VAGDIKSYRIIWKPFKTESLLRMIENAMSGGPAATQSDDSA
jgi:hypothetical protein